MTDVGGTMRKDKIISALIGLIGACNNNPKTENTDLVVIKALSLSALCPGCGDDELQQMIDEIHAEKIVVTPGCAQCAMPCGNTSDYDMERIYHAADDIRTVKMDIISELCDAACGIRSCQESGLQPSVDMETFYKALSYIGYDLEREALLSLLAEIQGMNREIEKIRSTKDMGEKPYET